MPAKKPSPKSFRAMVAIRVLEEDAARLDALAERLPIASRHAIAREALRLGMTLLEKDPGQLVRKVGRPRPPLSTRHR